MAGQFSQLRFLFGAQSKMSLRVCAARDFDQKWLFCKCLQACSYAALKPIWLTGLYNYRDPQKRSLHGTFMLRDPFEMLHKAVGSGPELMAAYESFLSELFFQDIWSGGTLVEKRVPWTLAIRARDEARDTFASPGLYIWGVEKEPLYLGITLRSFSKRFSRYIWGKRSQCKLARDHQATLLESGVERLPEDIRAWYKRGHPGSTVRLQGALRFAEAGIDRIWFTLLPHTVSSEIQELERLIVPVAEAWNLSRKFEPLLNKDFKTQLSHVTGRED